MDKNKIKNFYKENKKLVLSALASLIILILILTTIYFSLLTKDTELDKFNDSILALMENVIEYEVEDDYEIINFPDKEEKISKDGKIKNSKGKKFEEFKEGYVIIYKDGTYAFRITNGLYCGIKNYNETGVEVDIFEPCSNYDVIYRKNKNEKEH